MHQPAWTPPTEAQLKASGPLADATMAALTNERGIHAETAVSAIARMAGSYLFASFNLPVAALTPGAPVLSDIANERGPLLVETLTAGLRGLDVSFHPAAVTSDPYATHPPQLSLLEMQQLLDPRLSAIATANDFSPELMAHSCALATGIMIYRTRSVLDPSIGFSLAVTGFVEGSKTVPFRATS